MFDVGLSPVACRFQSKATSQFNRRSPLDLASLASSIRLPPLGASYVVAAGDRQCFALVAALSFKFFNSTIQLFGCLYDLTSITGRVTIEPRRTHLLLVFDHILKSQIWATANLIDSDYKNENEPRY